MAHEMPDLSDRVAVLEAMVEMLTSHDMAMKADQDQT